MGNDEAAAPTKSYKASSPVQEQPSIHPYPDWASVQAYYGPGVAIPPTYLNSAVAPGHAPPPYVWGPQAFMPPYGTPFTAMYTPGAYAHPSAPPLGSHSQGQGIVPSPSTNEAVVIATPLGTGPLAKSSGNKGTGLLKKLKGLDDLPVSSGSAHGQSQSGDFSEEGLSDGSDENYEPGDYRIQRRGGSENNPVSGKHVGTRSSSCLALVESKDSANGEVKASTALTPANDVPVELWRQDERMLKREKRKQSNRESARRSRLRKLVETEELAVRVDTLGTENTTLRTEIMQLKELSDKLKLENTALMEKLKNSQSSQAEESLPERNVSRGLQNVSTENLLSRLNDSNSFGSGGMSEADTPENSSGKLHRLLGPSSRTDVAAAS